MRSGLGRHSGSRPFIRSFSHRNPTSSLPRRVLSLASRSSRWASGRPSDTCLSKTRKGLANGALAADTSFGIRVHNNASYDVAARVFIDGLNIFEFCQIPQYRSEGILLVRKNSSFLLRGWFLSESRSESFRFGSLPDRSGLSANQDGPSTITAVFFAAWSKGAERPTFDVEPNLASRGTSAGIGVPEFDGAVEVGSTLQSAVSVRIARSKAATSPLPPDRIMRTSATVLPPATRREHRIAHQPVPLKDLKEPISLPRVANAADNKALAFQVQTFQPGPKPRSDEMRFEFSPQAGEIVACAIVDQMREWNLPVALETAGVSDGLRKQLEEKHAVALEKFARIAKIGGEVSMNFINRKSSEGDYETTVFLHVNVSVSVSSQGANKTDRKIYSREFRQEARETGKALAESRLRTDLAGKSVLKKFLLDFLSDPAFAEAVQKEIEQGVKTP